MEVGCFCRPSPLDGPGYQPRPPLLPSCPQGRPLEQAHPQQNPVPTNFQKSVGKKDGQFELKDKTLELDYGF